jgi:hypothetical protein
VRERSDFIRAAGRRTLLGTRGEGRSLRTQFLTAKGGYAVHDQEGVGRAYLSVEADRNRLLRSNANRTDARTRQIIGKKIAELG